MIEPTAEPPSIDEAINEIEPQPSLMERIFHHVVYNMKVNFTGRRLECAA